MKKAITFGVFLFGLLFVLGCTQSAVPVKDSSADSPNELIKIGEESEEGPVTIPDGECLKEQYDYCAQFSEEECLAKSMPIEPNGEVKSCYWNSNINRCLYGAGCM